MKRHNSEESGVNEYNSPQNQFGVLAEYYDLLNYGVNYKKVADYIEGVFGIYNARPEIILDLACGTGNLSIELDGRGYDMIGLDLSYEMLSAASCKKRRGNPEKNILWINQDMTNFELYGTVDAVVCAFDSLNYITNAEDLKKCLALVHHYLNYGGVFVFDVNSKYKFEKVYGKNDFVIEYKKAKQDKNILCTWRNYYNKRTKICDFYMDFFIRDSKSGLYMRREEVQREKYYETKLLIDILKELGFEDINIFYDFDIDCREGEADEIGGIEKAERSKERICFSCVKKI